MKHPLLLGILIALLLLTLSACRTQNFGTIQRHATNSHIDTIATVHNRVDSIYMKDSIYIHEKGDTVLVEKWHTKYKYKYIYRDSVHVQVDSIPYPVEVEKRISYTPKLTRFLAMFGGIVLLGAICWLLMRISNFINR